MTEPTRVCPNPGNTPTNPADTSPAVCANIPNAYYDAVKKKCICCNTNGTYYKLRQPDGTNICAACSTSSTTATGTTTTTHVACGEHGYCKGHTVNPDATCVQYTSKQWGSVCPSPSSNTAVKCGGECYGSCRNPWTEWVSFMKCQQNTTTFEYECAATFAQAKSWIFWLLVIFIILLILAYAVWRRSNSNSDIVISRMSIPTEDLGQGVTVKGVSSDGVLLDANGD